MATVKLIIRENKVNADGKCVIYVKYTHNQEYCLFSTGEKVAPADWDAKNQRVRKSYRGFTALNETIQVKAEEIKEIARVAKQKRIDPTLAYVKAEVAQLLPQPVEEQNDFFKLYDDFIAQSKGVKAYNTVKQHRTAYNHLKAFQEACKYKLTLESINLDFHSRFVAYLFNQAQLGPNSVGDVIKNLKIFLGDLTDKGINKNLTFRDRKFKKPSAPVEIITLTQDELNQLVNLDLSKNKRLDRIRDLFIFGCTTGLRFSDMANLKPENIKDKFVQFTTVKTKDRLMVPLTAIPRQILAKYENHLPNVPSNQKMNDYLKELGELAQINEPVQRVKYIGAKRLETVYPKYALITTHAARRTFATLCREKGMSYEEIMKFTGHKSIKMLEKYLNVTNVTANTALLKAWGEEPLPAGN